MSMYSFTTAALLCEIVEAKFRRKDWPTSRYIFVQQKYLEDGKSEITFRLCDSGHICDYRPLEEDLYSNDWVEVGGINEE